MDGAQGRAMDSCGGCKLPGICSVVPCLDFPEGGVPLSHMMVPNGLAGH